MSGAAVRRDLLPRCDSRAQPQELTPDLCCPVVWVRSGQGAVGVGGFFLSQRRDSVQRSLEALSMAVVIVAAGTLSPLVR